MKQESDTSEFDKFNAVMRRVLSVSHDELKKREVKGCPECGKKQITNKQDGSEHEEGCQIGCQEQQDCEGGQ